MQGRWEALKNARERKVTEWLFAYDGALLARCRDCPDNLSITSRDFGLMANIHVCTKNKADGDWEDGGRDGCYTCDTGWRTRQ